MKNDSAILKEQEGIYAKHIKRLVDFLLSLLALIVLSPLFLSLTLVGMIAMKGNPFFFQARPGKNERIFRLIKFRTMTNEKDADGKLLPDEARIGKYGRFIRSTSLDELPELLNIIVGDMAIVGPRPQLVRDMVFMTSDQRRRHSVRAGLTGLAQVNGRNCISWEDKLELDLQYIDRGITLFGDLKIVIKTIFTVLKREGTVREGTVSDTDFGDYLLNNGSVTLQEYKEKQIEANEILVKNNR